MKPEKRIITSIIFILIVISIACTLSGRGTNNLPESNLPGSNLPGSDFPNSDLPGNDLPSDDPPDSMSGFPAFGPIQFAEGITDDYTPISPTSQFEYGITEIWVTFPYTGMQDGLSWTREWMFEGEEDVTRELIWDEGPAGITYAYYGYDDETIPLDPGSYQLNLYIEGQVARSATFVILGDDTGYEPDEPGTPEELIDPNLMPAWEILAYSNREILREVAQFVLDKNVELLMDDDLDAKGSYVCSTTSMEPGTIYISTDFWNRSSWEEVAAVLGHELTHGVQHMASGFCGCTVENEYYAFITEFYVLQETGRMDLLESKWRGAYSDDGTFSSNKLWAAVKEAYPECPDY